MSDQLFRHNNESIAMLALLPAKSRRGFDSNDENAGSHRPAA